uniref:Uncharacterized protein n=1 Tax=Tanacetum cinerariifolium TaxID=118510 RepID=A0A6L2J6C8_TANCI|nr:hypothetical protein [Tanacetum cinerariifolium]
MDDPKITMEEYIQLIADKARGRDQTFNWENATYSEEYCDDLDSFIDFETQLSSTMMHRHHIKMFLPNQLTAYTGINTVYPGVWIQRIDFLGYEYTRDGVALVFLLIQEPSNETITLVEYL